MPKLCTCTHPTYSPRNPYVCIACGGQRIPPKRRVTRSKKGAQKYLRNTLDKS